MQKTTVYLDPDQAVRLGRLAAATGRSQAELMREGIERVLEQLPEREFRSLGAGHHGSGDRKWDSRGVYRKARGKDPGA